MTVNVWMRNAALESYFEQLGIEMLLFQDLYVESIDTSKQTVFYCGFHPIEVKNREQILTAIKENIENNIIQNVIYIDFGYDLSFEEWNDRVAIFLPWMFFPPIKKGRYENKVTLPELDLAGIDL